MLNHSALIEDQESTVLTCSFNRERSERGGVTNRKTSALTPFAAKRWITDTSPLRMNSSLLFGVYAIFDLGQFLLKVLAVAGGGAIGFFGTGLFLKLVGRFFFRRKGQPPAYNFVRSLGMVALGFLVYLWAFGAGGGGFGGAGGWWPFGGKGGTGTDPSLSGQAPDKQAVEPLPKIIDKEKAASEHVIKVRFLGGKDVVEQRFYLVDQEKEAKNWEDLVIVLKKRQQADRALKSLEIELFQGSIDRDNPAVTRLENWARENRLMPKVIIHGVDGEPARPEPKDDWEPR
jgi:hypothetical protein